MNYILMALLIVILVAPVSAAALGVVISRRSETNINNALIVWYLKSTALYFLSLPVMLVGLVSVAIGVRYVRTFDETEQTFTDPRFAHLGAWKLVRLPSWLLPWDNSFDGVIGDKRGWFANWCIEHRISYPSRLAMWVWAAVRNPANYYNRVLTGCSVVDSSVAVLFGPEIVDEEHSGLNMVQLADAKGRNFPVVDWCYPWPFSKTHGIHARFGWKVKMDQAGTSADSRPQDIYKGAVYRISFWKEL